MFSTLLPSLSQLFGNIVLIIPIILKALIPAFGPINMDKLLAWAFGLFSKHVKF
jgi:hypothetical protein